MLCILTFITICTVPLDVARHMYTDMFMYVVNGILSHDYLHNAQKGGWNAWLRSNWKQYFISCPQELAKGYILWIFWRKGLRFNGIVQYLKPTISRANLPPKYKILDDTVVTMHNAVHFCQILARGFCNYCRKAHINWVRPLANFAPMYQRDMLKVQCVYYYSTLRLILPWHVTRDVLRTRPS